MHAEFLTRYFCVTLFHRNFLQYELIIEKNRYLYHLRTLTLKNIDIVSLLAYKYVTNDSWEPPLSNSMSVYNYSICILHKSCNGHTEQ